MWDWFLTAQSDVPATSQHLKNFELLLCSDSVNNNAFQNVNICLKGSWTTPCAWCKNTYGGKQTLLWPAQPNLCSRARQGVFTSGAWSCRYLKRPLFIESLILTLFGGLITALFRPRVGFCYWSTAGVTREAETWRQLTWPCRCRLFIQKANSRSGASGSGCSIQYGQDRERVLLDRASSSRHVIGTAWRRKKLWRWWWQWRWLRMTTLQLA